ncbi:PREDICTED: uncharacterized protein LOC106805928 isoform X2 [Priapulus caudatus]|uniref:Uncharacterized protein LOC106805928 isoform X2 n=1 Tax=Priapulus caudatus TaxID=37621 RepID=A0ABM1DTB8_PRICU|nr:PREDICTED: uncharacterized protein LOC106805928 isoform X2 [Priapulus caudatus]
MFVDNWERITFNTGHDDGSAINWMASLGIRTTYGNENARVYVKFGVAPDVFDFPGYTLRLYKNTESNALETKFLRHVKGMEEYYVTFNAITESGNYRVTLVPCEGICHEEGKCVNSLGDPDACTPTSAPLFIKDACNAAAEWQTQFFAADCIDGLCKVAFAKANTPSYPLNYSLTMHKSSQNSTTTTLRIVNGSDSFYDFFISATGKYSFSLQIDETYGIVCKPLFNNTDRIECPCQTVFADGGYVVGVGPGPGNETTYNVLNVLKNVLIAFIVVLTMLAVPYVAYMLIRWCTRTKEPGNGNDTDNAEVRPRVFLCAYPDHQPHWNAVESLADWLSDAAGCDVTFAPRSIGELAITTKTEWVEGHLQAADKIVVVESEGSARHRDALKSGSVWRPLETRALVVAPCLLELVIDAYLRATDVLLMGAPPGDRNAQVARKHVFVTFDDEVQGRRVAGNDVVTLTNASHLKKLRGRIHNGKPDSRVSQAEAADARERLLSAIAARRAHEREDDDHEHSRTAVSIRLLRVTHSE